jgi:hypothetical protein
MGGGGPMNRMKRIFGNPGIWFALASAALALPRIAAAPAATGDTLYVTVDSDDPIAFKLFRYGYNDGKDLIIDTLRAKAGDMAQAAHWSGPIVVLDENTPPPAGAHVLRLNWDDSGGSAAGVQTLGGGRSERDFTVSAEYLPNPDAKPRYLGVVSRESLAFHPTPDLVYTRIRSAPNDFARRDETVRAKTELNLFLALQRARKQVGSAD